MSSTYKVNEKCKRAWGEWQVLNTEGDHVVKRVMVWPGESLHLQTHKYRSEFWVLITGKAEVTIGRRKYIKQAGDHIFIPAGEYHCIANIGEKPLLFIEVQTGEKLDEADIVHYNDDYEPI